MEDEHEQDFGRIFSFASLCEDSSSVKPHTDAWSSAYKQHRKSRGM